MSIYDFKNEFELLESELEQYVSLNSPYSDQVTADQERLNNLVSNMEVITSAILEPANSWETSLQKAQDCVESNDITNCHTNLSAVQCGVKSSIQSVSLQLSVVENTLEEVQNSLDIIYEAFQSGTNSIDTTNYDNLKSVIENIFNEIGSYKNLCQSVIDDMQEIVDVLNLGTNPYDYEMYNSVTTLKMQIATSLTDIQTLRTDYF